MKIGYIRMGVLFFRFRYKDSYFCELKVCIRGMD